MEITSILYNYSSFQYYTVLLGSFLSHSTEIAMKVTNNVE